MLPVFAFGQSGTDTMNRLDSINMKFLDNIYKSLGYYKKYDSIAERTKKETLVKNVPFCFKLCTGWFLRFYKALKIVFRHN